jgi:hypothetical protein
MSGYSFGDSRRPKHIPISTLFQGGSPILLKQQPLCVQWASRDREFGGYIGIAIGIAMVLELVSRPNPSRVLLRTLEGFNHGIQEADEMERGGQEGAGDAVGTGKRPFRNSMKSGLVMGSSLLADVEREWKGKRQHILG